MEQTETKKVAIITGASSGIGLLLARHLHSKGWRIAIFGRRLEAGQKQATALDPSGETAIFEQCDVASYQAQCTAYKNVWAKWCRLDLVIPNAGAVDEVSWYNLGGKSNTVDDLPPEPSTACTDIHLKGVMYGTLLSTHFFRHNPVPGGKLILTGSIIGVFSCPTFPEYCANEAGLIQWTRTMAPLLKSKDNVTINIVAMGACATPVIPDFPRAFKTDHLALPATVLEAYDVFINDDSRTGQVLETAHDKLIWHEVPKAEGGEVTLRTTKVYEPWFTWIHGERSDLGPDMALEGPPEGNAADSARLEEFKVGFT